MDRPWTLLTNHGRVLLLIAKDPESRIRDLAKTAEVTERTAQAIVGDLESAGYLTKRAKAGAMCTLFTFNFPSATPPKPPTLWAN